MALIQAKLDIKRSGITSQVTDRSGIGGLTVIQRRTQILLLNIGPPIFARLQQNFLTLDKLDFALHNLFFSEACDQGLLGSRNII